MARVISLKFRDGGREYYFDASDKIYREGEIVVVDTALGTECGTVTKASHTISDDQIVKPLKKVIRRADQNDLKKLEQNRKKAAAAFETCEQKIEKYGLDMKLVDVEVAFETGKMTFTFTSDGRVDFRELVKDLASTFHARIELRQIGVRDEARMLGGLGICGQPFCCARFLDDFQPVSIKMAKEQGLSLNPTKISGSCGRLMCCLKYEQDAYVYLNKRTPKVGSTVSTPEGVGVVTDVNLLRGILTVQINDSLPVKVNKDEVTLIKPPPKNKNKKAEEEIPDELNQ